MTQQLLACPATGKISYATRAKAVKGLRHPRSANRHACRVYRCGLCGHWHLTSQRHRNREIAEAA